MATLGGLLHDLLVLLLIAKSALDPTAGYVIPGHTLPLALVTLAALLGVGAAVRSEEAPRLGIRGWIRSTIMMVGYISFFSVQMKPNEMHLYILILATFVFIYGVGRVVSRVIPGGLLTAVLWVVMLCWWVYFLSHWVRF